MSRLESVITKYHTITLQTPKVSIPEKERATTPVRFTLSFEGRTLQGHETTENNTITPTRALAHFFHLANAVRFDSRLHETSAENEQRLRAFLGQQYDVFQQAFLDDLQEERDQLRAANKKVYDDTQTKEESRFVPGERVRYLMNGMGLREEDWVYCTVIQEEWQDGFFRGILVRREKDGKQEIKNYALLFKV